MSNCEPSSPAGWGGRGLGAGEQGREEPVEAADVRDRQDMHKGIGMDLRDPFEAFRKNKSQGFIQRMKTRDEEKSGMFNFVYLFVKKSAFTHCNIQGGFLYFFGYTSLSVS